jgi:hypothetical protein
LEGHPMNSERYFFVFGITCLFALVGIALLAS